MPPSLASISECIQIFWLYLLQILHIHLIFRMIFCKLFCDLQFLPHISRKIFVRRLPFFTDRFLKITCQFFGKLCFCFPGKLCHIGKVNACPLTDRNRKCFTGSIYRSYRFCPADCPFGKNIRSVSVLLIIQKFQRVKRQ